MWIRLHLGSEQYWLLGLNRYDGFDNSLKCHISCLAVGFGLFSIAFCVRKSTES